MQDNKASLIMVLCIFCGHAKNSAPAQCSHCQKKPATNEEIAKCWLMSEEFMHRQALFEAADAIRTGRGVVFPPDLVASLATTVTKELRKQKAGRIFTWVAIAAMLAVILSVIAYLTPKPNYLWAKHLDSVDSYMDFTTRFPDSEYYPAANERLRQLLDDVVWKESQRNNTLYAYRNYLRRYPHGKHLAEAQAASSAFADQEWRRISPTATIKVARVFLTDYPETTLTSDVEKRIREIEDEGWNRLRTQGRIPDIRSYMAEHPDSPHLPAARKRITELADLLWTGSLAQSRDDVAIEKFIVDYPETTHRTAARTRLQFLYDDFDWICEKDRLELYRDFLKRFPNHRQKSRMEKRIIDLEVKEIAAGEYGELPPVQPTSRGGSRVKVAIENQTSHVLTVRYSGPESTKLVIPAGQTSKTTLTPGDYQVAASVDAAGVTNYYGKDTMQAGEYSSSFFINTTTVPSYNSYSPPSASPSFSIPRMRKRR